MTCYLFLKMESLDRTHSHPAAGNNLHCPKMLQLGRLEKRGNQMHAAPKTLELQENEEKINTFHDGPCWI